MARGSATLARARPATQVRVAFIDNIRILLVVVLILFHLAIAYGGEGPWRYQESGADTITTAVLTLFVTINQAFFMGFYFLIAAYFVPRALERKGSFQFLKERFLRLGVPLAFYLLVVSPLISYGLGITIWGYTGSFWGYIGDYWRKYELLDVGPLWFVEALLIFSIIYALWWRLAQPQAHQARSKGAAPGNVAVAIFALAMGLVTFLVRIWLPVGWYFAPLGLQFPHFPQYIGLFFVGTIAYRRGWLSTISEDAARGKLWGGIVAFLVALAPVLFVLGGALEGNTEPFRGGLHWQNLVYALWEQFLCVAMVISLLVWFRKRRDQQGKLARTMSSNAYATYVFHAPILMFVSIGLRSVELYPLLKFALVAAICIPLCFLAGGLVRKLPVARRIF